MTRLLRRFAQWLRQRRHDADLAAELEAHRALKQDAFERAGLAAEDAERASRRALGNIALAREDARAVWIWPSIESLWRDVRLGARSLRRNPGFTTVAVLTLALGIGVNSMMFSVIEAVLLRPPPYDAPHQLAMLWTDDAKHGVRDHPTSYHTYADWRAQSRLFSDMAIFQGEPAILAGPSGTERVLAHAVSANLFAVLGARPAAGRVFTADEEDRGEPVVVISHAVWMRQFGGSANVLNEIVTVRGESGETRYRIVGVMAESFYFPNKDVQFWRPTVHRSASGQVPRWRTEPRFRFVVNDWGVIGRLRDAASVQQAQVEMTTIGQRLALAYPTSVDDFPGFAVSVVPLADQFTGGTLRQALWLLFGAVGMVLLIACANVANLLLARGVARAQEFAIRAALGGNRWRLLRQSLAETAVLTLAATLLGLLISSVGIRALAAYAPAGVYPAPSTSYPLTDSVRVPVASAQPGVPRLDEIGIDEGILIFTIGVSVLAALIFGLAPARRVSRSDPQTVLAGAGRASSSRALGRSRNALVAVECTLAVVLLAGAGLMLRSLARLDLVAPGFTTDNVLLVRTSLAPGGGGLEAPATDAVALRQAFYHEVRAHVRALPGVESVGLITDFLASGSAADLIAIPGRPREPSAEFRWAAVDPGFFPTIQVPLLRGRFFTDLDSGAQIEFLRMSSENQKRRNAAQPTIVNETFARRYFPAADPVGRRFGTGSTARTMWHEIVGVVGDMRRESLDRLPVAEYFTPYIGQTSEVAVRTSADPLRLAGAIRDAIRSVDKNAIVMTMTTLDRKLAEVDAHRRLLAWLLTLFAGLSLALAAIGIFGVVRYSVVQRRREIGIRISLGAGTSDVLWLILGRGLAAPLAGMLTGLALALGLTRLLAHLLYETSPTDALTLTGVGLTLLVVAGIACCLPALRAARMNPVATLRSE